MRGRVFVLLSFWTERQLFTLLISIIIEIVESYQSQYIKTIRMEQQQDQLQFLKRIRLDRKYSKDVISVSTSEIKAGKEQFDHEIAMRDRIFVSSFPFLGTKVTFSAEKIVENCDI